MKKISMKIQSKSKDLTEQLLQCIRNGIYPDGSALPSEDALSAEYKVSRSTVRTALENLRSQGVVSKAKGKKSTVCTAALNGGSRQLRFGWIGFGALNRLPVYLEIYTELQKATFGINGTLTFLPIENPQSEEWISNIAATFDGVFLSGVRKGMVIPKLEEVLTAMNNVIEIDDLASPIGHYTVCTDNYAAGRMAASYLLERQCRIAAFVDTQCALYRGFHDRMCGFVDGCRASGVTPWMYPCGSNPVADPPPLKQVLSEHPEINTIWHVTDRGALDIRRLIEREFPRENGYYRSAGVDGIPAVLEGAENHLSLAHPVQEIAHTAFRTMLDLLEGKTPAEPVHLLKPILIPWQQ